METSPASTLVGVAAGEPVRASSDLPATSLQHEVALPKLVRSWSGAYCRPFVGTQTLSACVLSHISASLLRSGGVQLASCRNLVVPPRWASTSQLPLLAFSFSKENGHLGPLFPE